jgi:hypothetical protein
MEKNIRVILLTVLTLSVFVIAVIELTGISSNSLSAWMEKHKQSPASMVKPTVDAREMQVSNMPGTTIAFAEKKFDFGTITKGSVVKHAFRFTNTGQNPLMIARADVSCGCTVPQFPKESIAPGKDGEIIVQFNSAGKSGKQQKNILVHSNAQPGSESITIEADVK